MDVDIVCVGFGPAIGGLPHDAVARGSPTPTARRSLESAVMPGMPLQVLCYERADDIGFGVSGVVTRARGIRADLPRPRPVADSHGHAGDAARRSSTSSTRSGASRRSATLRAADDASARLGRLAPYEHDAFELP